MGSLVRRPPGKFIVVCEVEMKDNNGVTSDAIFSSGTLPDRIKEEYEKMA